MAQAAEASAAGLVTEVKAVADHDEAEYERRKLDLERVSALFADKAHGARRWTSAANPAGGGGGSPRGHRQDRVRASDPGGKDRAIAKARADQDSAAARCEVTKADRERIETMLQYTAIRAPFNGLIAQRNVDTGHLVPVGHAAEKPLFVVVRADLLRIFVDVPEGDAATVDAGSEAQVRVPALSGIAFPAKVARTAWVLNTGTRTLRAEIDIPNADGRLRPGMYAYADLKVAERRDVLSLPKTALLTQDGKPCCLCIEASGKVASHAPCHGTPGRQRGGDHVRSVGRRRRDRAQCGRVSRGPAGRGRPGSTRRQVAMLAPLPVARVSAPRAGRRGSCRAASVDASASPVLFIVCHGCVSRAEAGDARQDGHG